MARKITIQCPACLIHIKASVRLIGQMRDCPRCGNAFLVPDPNAENVEKMPTAAPKAEPVLISQMDTVDMRLEWDETRPGKVKSLEELDAEGLRVRNLVAQYYRIIGRPDDRTV